VQGSKISALNLLV